MTKLTLGKPVASKKLDEIAAIQKQASIAKYQKIQQQEAEEARKKRYEVAIGILKSLEQLFPNCFSQTEPKPLKLHIEADLFALESVAALGVFPHIQPKLAMMLLTEPPWQLFSHKSFIFLRQIELT